LRRPLRSVIVPAVTDIVTEVAPEHAVGTALTLQTALGFLLTSISIAAVPHLRAAGGWPLAFGLLAVGPALGIAAMRLLASGRAPRSSMT